MTRPAVRTIRRGGSRFYVNPETGDKVPGVTSIIDMLPKPFLKFWAAKVVAESAVANAATLSALVAADRAGAIDMLKRAPTRDVDGAAKAGTDAHAVFDTLSRGEPLPDGLDQGTLLYAKHFTDFLAEYKPKFLHTEATVWSDTHKYAGTFDALAEIDGSPVWVDYKTTRSGIHEEVGLQLAAYSHADYILRPDGTRVPLPKATEAAVVHLRPEGWSVVPVRIDEDVFAVFLHLREVFDWDTALKFSVLGNPL